MAPTPPSLLAIGKQKLMERASTTDSAFLGIRGHCCAMVFGVAVFGMSVAAQESIPEQARVRSEIERVTNSPFDPLRHGSTQAKPTATGQEQPTGDQTFQKNSRERKPKLFEVSATPVSAPVEPNSASPGDKAVNEVEVESRFDRDAAFGYLKDICEIGPRPSASPGMQKQQLYLQQHFARIGGRFLSQSFSARSPYDGRWVQLHNIVIQWHPERTKRLMICCHYDTRPFADSDRQNPRAKFIGANDGGSGVALLCELGKHMAALEGNYGVDFVFFDGEEFVIQPRRDPMFLGSTYFAQQYAQGNIGWKYEQAVLVDMVADKDLQIFLEGNSMHFARGLTLDVWSVAKSLGVHEFIPEEKRFIRDDHLALNEIAKIPTCDIIDFDFPNPRQGNIYWHTREDKLENCSAESLGKVGSVVLAWIRFKQNQN